MNNSKWLLFSFSLPAKLQGFRVKIWRKLNTLGAIQIKNAIYVLPANEQHLEHLTWMAKETDEQGGEALIIAHGELTTLPDEQIHAAFTRARDEEYREIEEELRPQLDQADKQELLATLRKFEKRLEAVKSRDFFPSGKGEALRRMPEEAHDRSGHRPPVIARLNPLDYQGKTWVTRANPYVDRLASFWLVRRFIDPAAALFLLAPGEATPPGPHMVPFDMAEGALTHVEGLITFEVISEAFTLGRHVPPRMRQVLRAIDLEEMDTAPPETVGVKMMLDGLVAATPDDFLRVERALPFFDTLLASYSTTRQGPSQ